MGDYIDRGPNSSGVLDRLIRVGEQCRLVPLLGNHEEALLDALQDKNALRRWLTLGGAEALRSYGWAPGGPRRRLVDWFPEQHRDFIARCRDYFETPTHLFVPAGFVPELPLAEQPSLALRWRVTDAATAIPHQSGKVAVVGHTPQQSGEVLDLGFLVCIDTNCVRGGRLTALDVGNFRDQTVAVWRATATSSLIK